MTSTLRSLLARLGIRERRWIPSDPERNAHRDRVRERLPDPEAVDGAGTPETENDAPTTPRRRRRRQKARG